MRLSVIALGLLGLALGAPVRATGAESPPAPKSDEELLAFSLNIDGCIGVVQVLRRTIDSGQHGQYTEYLDVKPIRWLSGKCGSAKTRLYAAPHSAFGFMSTGDWEVGARDTVIVFTYRDKGRSFVAQTPHTLWRGLARATPERIQFLETNVPRLLEGDSLGRRDTTR